MARDLTVITTLTADVVLTAPVHVGAAATGPGELAAVLRDGAGRAVLPGTTVAGVLRSVLDPAVDLDRWGGVEQDSGGAPAPGASRVVVHDAVLDVPGPDARRGRDGVAIDRALGSAADQLLHPREVVPAGATATLRVEVHSTTATEAADRQLLADVVALLAGGALAVGARTSRGLGALDLRACTVVETRFDDPAAFWTTRHTPAPVELPPSTAGHAPDVVDVTIHWAPCGPVFVGSGGLHSGRPDGAVALPLAEPDPGDPERLRLVLPGTSLAGALRSRAELICRTLHPPAPDVPADLPAQLASAPLAEALFGGPAGRTDTTASPLTVADCPSTTTIAVGDWLPLLGPNPPLRTPTSDGGACLALTTHVAVDRWTGGAADGRLFRVAEPHGFAFSPIRLRLDRRRVPESLRDAATMLLLLTVRELVAGRVPLGAGTHRGHGDLSVTKVRVRGAGLDLDGVDGFDGLTRCPDLRAAWRAWLAEEAA